jgi:GntR family transcriptional regulator, hexuronate regulon transcriptional repressor
MARAAATDIARSLRQRIEAGEWSETGRIPPERDLAVSFGVARNTMRRAMHLLREEGAISRHIGRGTFVRPDNGGALSDIAQRMSGSSPADMMEIRLLLEPSAAAFAATNASASELASVEEAHRNAVTAVDMATFEHWDAEFHHRIFASSRNALLKEMHSLLCVLRNQSPWFEMKRRAFSEERRLRYCSEHLAVLEGLVGRDPDSARGAMQRHLTTVRTNLLGK